MTKAKKTIYLITLVFILITTSIINTTSCNAAVANDKGFIKVAGNIGMKSDGSLWNFPTDLGDNYVKIMDGFLDIDTDWLESSYIALKKDGTLWVWGKNDMGQFAQSKLNESKKPIKIMDNVKAISGLSALKKDGSVWTWGGKLFLNKESKTHKPKLLYKGAKSIAYGTTCVYITDKNSTLYAIRNNYNSYIFTNNVNKVKIADKVKFISNNHYITNDNCLWAIDIIEKEIDQNGQVIDYDFIFKPILILTNVVYTSSSDASRFNNKKGTTCAIRSDGSLWIWGIDYSVYEYKGCYSKPQKLMNGAKNVKCGYCNIKVINKDGTISTYGSEFTNNTFCLPKVISKNISNVYEEFSWMLRKDNVLLWIPSYFDTSERIVSKNAYDSVTFGTHTANIKMDDKTTFEHHINDDSYSIHKYNFDFKQRSSNIYLKNDNTLWE